MTGAVLVLIGAGAAWGLTLDFPTLPACQTAREIVTADDAYLKAIRDMKSAGATLELLQAQQPILDKRKVAQNFIAECIER